jgi:hypothetical protein
MESILQKGSLVRHYDLIGLVVDPDPYGNGSGEYAEILWTDSSEPSGFALVVWDVRDFKVIG